MCTRILRCLSSSTIILEGLFLWKNDTTPSRDVEAELPIIRIFLLFLNPTISSAPFITKSTNSCSCDFIAIEEASSLSLVFSLSVKLLPSQSR